MHENIFGVCIIFTIWIYLQPTNVFFHDKHNILIYVHGIDIVYPYLLVKVKGNSHMILFTQKGFKGRKKRLQPSLTILSLSSFLLNIFG